MDPRETGTVELTALSVLPLVRFDQNTGCRLFPETRVPSPGPERELHSTLRPPATHPLQERQGAPRRAERSRPPGASEEIPGFKSPQITRPLCRQEIGELGGRPSRPPRRSGRAKRWHQPRWPAGASWPRSSSHQASARRRPHTRREAEATLLRETEEMYVRAISPSNPCVA